jgi:hypothetical protein
VISGPTGVHLRCITDKFVADVCHPHPSEELRAVLPLDLLEDLDTRRSNETIQLRKVGNQIEAQWTKGGTPRSRLYSGLLPKPHAFPAWPVKHCSNPDHLRAALDQVAKVAAKQSARSALDHICLSGKTGEVIGTDGRQLLLLGGFEFPWTGDVLIPALSVVSLKELSNAKAILIAEAEGHVLLRLGEWSFAFPIPRDTRFPNVAAAIPKIEGDATTWRLAEGAGPKLVATLDDLPGAGSDSQPVTVDLGQHVALRAVDEGQPRPTEVIGGGTAQGKPLCCVMDRRYLARAIQLGFDTFAFPGPDRPIVCRDRERTMVWMPLPSSSAIPSHPNAIRIEIPALAPKRSTTRVKATPKTKLESSHTPAAPPAPAVPVDPRTGWSGLFRMFAEVQEMIRDRLREPEWT